MHNNAVVLIVGSCSSACKLVKLLPTVRWYFWSVPAPTVDCVSGIGVILQTLAFHKALCQSTLICVHCHVDRFANAQKCMHYVHKFKRSVYVFCEKALGENVHPWLALADGPNSAMQSHTVYSNKQALVSLLQKKLRTVQKKIVYPEATRFKDDQGPFDIIGDVHGCYDELCALLKTLGYEWDAGRVSHPLGRKCVFVGDLVDRGPRPLQTLDLVRNCVLSGAGYAVLGNHDDKLARALQGHKVQMRHGLLETWELMQRVSEEKKQRYLEFLTNLPLYIMLDEGRMCVVHAGLFDKDVGFMSARIRTMCLYGLITGQKDANGFPVRGDWTTGRTSPLRMVYGHTPVKCPVWQRNTLNLDTGCAFGHKLTALRWPENACVQVASNQPASKALFPELFGGEA